MPLRAVLPIITLLAAAISAAAGESTPAATLEAELRPKAEAAVKARTLGQFGQDVKDRALKLLAEPGVLEKRAPELEVLEHYLNVGTKLDFKYDDTTADFLVWLLAQREFCARFLHALDAPDSPEKAVDVLRRLRAVKGIDEKTFLAYGEMAIAFAVVWDNYKWLPWTNIEPPPERMEEIYQYYVSNEKVLPVKVNTMPHEVAVYIVDHPLIKEEREYALANFRNCKNYGQLFFDIKWIMNESSLYEGHNKKIPYTLMNIKKYSGVCVEQAYYASCIAKCYGIPAAFCRGVGERGGHAWVGQLVISPRNILKWDFGSGRYFYDHYWQGEVYNPTNREEKISDGEVGMTAGTVSLAKPVLESADARRNLAELLLGDRAALAAAGKSGLTPEKHKLVCSLLYTSVKANPFSRRTWNLIGLLGSKGEWSFEEIKSFTDLLYTTVDMYSSDFVCSTTIQLLESVTEIAERDRLYENCFQYFRNRPDLAAEIKVAQGRMREANGKPDQAARSYLDAVTFFPRDGHVTQEAGERLDKLLAKGEPKKAVETLITVWRAIYVPGNLGAPEEREAMRIVGENLLKYMKLAGMTNEAAEFENTFKRICPVRKPR